MRQARIFKLESAGDDSRKIRFLSDRISLQDDRRHSTVTITRAGKYYDPRYGDFEITRAQLAEMIKNFDNNAYGQKIALDVAHRPSDGAAGFFTRLFLQGDNLRGEVDWTPFGADAVKKRGMRYLSGEFTTNYTTNEHPRKEVGAVLFGAALTPRPVIKNMDPVDPDSIELSETSEGVDPATPTFISQSLRLLLSEEFAAMKKFLEQLRTALTSKKALGEALVKSLCDLFEKAAVALGEDETRLKALVQHFVEQGDAISKQLAEGGADKTLKLDFSGLEDILKGKTGDPEDKTVKGLSAEDVKKLFSELQQADAKKLADDKKALDDKLAVFDAALAEKKDLDATTVKELSAEVRPSINAGMSEDQVKRLAGTIIKSAEQISAAKKLSAKGFNAGGNVRITLTEQEKTPLQLQEEIHKRLAGTSAHQNGGLKLMPVGKEKAAVARILALFDQVTGAARMEDEIKYLAGGVTAIADAALPSSFQRTVIREALSDLQLLDLVNVIVDSSAQQTINIPYELRDTSGVVNDGVVFEGQGINGMSMSQRMDIAYLSAIKIALKISNEVAFFSKNNALIDWDAYGRNVAMAARVVREIICRRIANEIQRVSDAYGAISIANEDYHAQLDGVKTTVKSVQYPIVRQQQIKDMAGNNIGNASNPITVKLNGAVVQPYDGTNTQGAGTYYKVLDYNLGYVQFVNQLGVPVAPAYVAGATTLSYDYATNIVKFNTDLGADVLDIHWNGFLQQFGAAKATLEQDRFVEANFAIMSVTLNDSATNAKNFSSAFMKSGSDTTPSGDLATIKAVPCYKTNAPGVDLGEVRAILGVRGNTAYAVSKPWLLGAPFEAVDNQGRPTGQKVSYGEEYSAVQTPLPLRKQYISVLAYSFAGR